MSNPNELRARREALVAEAKRISDAAQKEHRDLDSADAERFDKIMAKISAIDSAIKRMVQLIGVESPAPESEQSGRAVRSADSFHVHDEDAKRFSILRAARGILNGNPREMSMFL